MSQALDTAALKNQSVIITGGASGLGLATATYFARAGAYVTIADVQETLGQKVAADLVSEGHHATYIYCDVTDWNSSVKAFKHAVSFSPSKTLDIAALYAGIEGDVGSLTDQVLAAPEPSLDEDAIPPQPAHRGIDVNLKGLYDNAWLSLYYMRLPSKVEIFKTKSLILVASLAAYLDMPPNSDYNASKFGARGLFRGLRYTTSQINVRLNLIVPFWINTPIIGDILKRMEAVGVTPGKGITFADIKHVVDASTKCAIDESTSGRAFCIVPEGYFDLNDDEDGGWGGDFMKEQLKTRRSKGDFI